jgi:hypothetical protein
MKRKMLIAASISALLFAVGPLMARGATPKEDVEKAAKKLGEQSNYAWKTTVVVPEDARFRPGPTEGKTEKDGYTYLKLSLFDNTIEAVLKGDKGAVTNQDGDWQSFADLENAEGPGRFLGMMMRNTKTPAAQAAELAKFAKELKQDGDVYAGELTEEGAKSLLSFGRRGGDDGPTISDAKASAKFWVKDGELTKYEFAAKATFNFNGNDFPVDRTTTVVIKDVGKTKVEIPEGAKKKLSP